MKVLFDTNVILDLLLDRKPFSTDAAILLSKVESGKLKGYICATTVTTIHYLASKAIGPIESRKEIKRLLGLVDVSAVNRKVLESALDSRIMDFEDAVIVFSGIHSGVDTIVTRNLKDFKYCQIPVYSPDEFLKVLQVKQ